MYTAEHADLNPVTEPDGSTTASGATLFYRLMRRTDDTGNIGAAGMYGPYLRNWPVNLYNRRLSIRIDGPAAGANTHGWRIASATLRIEPDHVSGVAVVGGGAAIHTGGGAAPVDGE